MFQKKTEKQQKQKWMRMEKLRRLFWTMEKN